SLEGSDFLAARSAKTLAELGLSEVGSVRVGEFGATLDDAIRDLEPLDWAFIDGNHVEEATVSYAETLLHHTSSEALLVFDDINWSEGMRHAWSRIVADDR
ncbi:class I SAM-dependent methyltransferase, partial [Rhizobium johnstonii]|uniref:class I SAM-dependent methyltransferase n=1 Tax=Rhizobium johnstonii TaxID=3019933 RepID=UPI003F947605